MFAETLSNFSLFSGAGSGFRFLNIVDLSESRFKHTGLLRHSETFETLIFITGNFPVFPGPFRF